MKKHVDSDTPFLVHEEGIDLNLCQFAGARPNSLSEIGDLGGKTADVDRFRTPISVKQMRQFQTAQPGLDLARIAAARSVTTELGARHPGGTRNPHHREHTPGGSSSGSAAAVGARMAPLAIGTQTNGSVIRPASFCGVVGFKPSFGLIPRTGILPQAPPLDTAGVFARSVPDAALIVDARLLWRPAPSVGLGLDLGGGVSLTRWVYRIGDLPAPVLTTTPALGHVGLSFELRLP